MTDASTAVMTYGGSTVGCPDPEVLAQLGTSALGDDERGALLDHAAGCSECHAAVAVFAAQPTRAMPPQVARIDRYELRRIVGVGAMGVVYAAVDPELDREVAVKVLRPNASAARLRREAQALAKLTDPNVVRVYDVGEHEGKTFIAMELVEGENLREWLRTPHALDEIVGIVVQAGRGLAAAHRAGLVHRDFKPDNVLLARSGGVLVGDFGLARSAELSSSADAAAASPPVDPLSSQSLTMTGALVGTPAYMAPEQANGDATAASDQYAFCVTAWEACFGERPTKPIELHKPATHSVPKRIEEALRRGLSAHPQGRFPSMDALLHALQPRGRRRWPWIAAASLASLATAIVLVATAMSTRTSAVRCDDAGALIAPAWTPAIEAQLGERWGAGVSDGFARYAARWQEQRVAACVATHHRHEQTVATLERQVACLDRARDVLHTTIEALVHMSVALPRPASAVQSLPSLARCEGAAAVQALPPPDRAAAIAALDQELAKIDVSLLAGAPSVSASATVAQRQRAETLAYAPQVFRAMLLEARVASWSGDTISAESVLRRTLILADQNADDLTRAHAGALLAGVIHRRTAEATGLLATARAALTRAGSDPAIEHALLESEVAIATNAGHLQEAVAAQERIVALARARFGEDSPILAHAYSRLNVAWATFGDYSKAMAAQRLAIEIVTRIEKPPADIKALLSETIIELVTVGDYEGAIALGRRQLAAMRALPAHSLKVEAYTAGQVAFALEMDGNYREAAAAYRETEQLWGRPLADFTTVGEEPDPAAIANGITDAVYSRATCLLRLDLAAEAVAELKRAETLAIAGGAATASLLEPITRWRGQALVAAKRYREARDILEPMADHLTTSTMLKPFPRAAALFALAQALWADGGARDRPRALALAGDAERHLATAIVDGETQIFLRKLPAQARVELAAIAAWRASRAAP